MAGLQDFLLDAQGRLRSSSAVANPPRPPGDVPPLGRFLMGGKAAKHVTGLSQPMQQRLLSMFNSMPPEVQAGTQILSGYRTPEEQQILWDRALQKYGSPAAARKWVAPPGSSQHNHRNAVDLHYMTPEARKWAHANAAKHGLKFPLKNEAWHVEVSETRNGPAFTGNLNTDVQTASASPAARPTMPPPSGSVARGRGVAISPDMAMSKLQSLGFNEAQSKAMVGNLVAESSLRPDTVNSKEGAYGLMQWRGERFAGLNEFARSKGTTWRDPNTQLEYIAHEMKNNAYENKQSAAFRQATTVEDANRALKSYIRYGSNTEQKRLDYANAVQTPAGNVAASSVANQAGPQAINAAVPLPQPRPSDTAYAPTTTPAPAATTFDPEGAGYDYDAARKAGLGPDATGHWPSRDPATGAILKGRQHPTWDLTEKGERDAGNAIYSRDGRYYSGTIDNRIDAQIEKMYGVPPEAPAPAVPSVQERIDQHIAQNYPPDPPAAAVEAAVPLPRPRPEVDPQARAQGSPQQAAATPRPRVTVNAQAPRAESPQGRSKLAQGIIAGYGPAGRDLTTYVDPATGHEVITGSMGGETIARNLGRTGAGQAASGPSSMSSVRRAVENAVPLPRDRPAMPAADTSWPPKVTPDPLRDAGTRELGGRGLLQPFEAPTKDFDVMGGVHRGRGGFNTLGEWPPAPGQDRLSLSPFQSTPSSPQWTTPPPLPGAAPPAPQAQTTVGGGGFRRSTPPAMPTLGTDLSSVFQSGFPSPQASAPSALPSMPNMPPMPAAASPQMGPMLQWWQLDPNAFGSGGWGSSFNSTPGGYFSGGSGISGFSGVGFSDYGGGGGW